MKTLKAFSNRLCTSILTVTALLVSATAMMAADFNGKWSGEAQNKKGSVPMTLELKADGAVVTGSLSRGKRGRGIEIKNGKIEGDSITFTTMQKTKKGEREAEWKGTLEGSEMKLSPVGKRRAPAITLKRT